MPLHAFERLESLRHGLRLRRLQGGDQRLAVLQVPVAGNQGGRALQFFPGPAGIACDQCAEQGVDALGLAAVQKQVSLAAVRRPMAVHQQLVQQWIGRCHQFAARTVAQAMIGNPFGNQFEPLGKGQGRFQDFPGEPHVVDCFVEAGNPAGSPGSIAFFGEQLFRLQQLDGRIFLVCFEQLMDGTFD